LFRVQIDVTLVDLSINWIKSTDDSTT